MTHRSMAALARVLHRIGVAMWTIIIFLTVLLGTPVACVPQTSVF